MVGTTEHLKRGQILGRHCKQIILIMIGIYFFSDLTYAALYQGHTEDHFVSFHYNKENCSPVQNSEETFHKGLFFPNDNLRKRGLADLMPREEIRAASLRTYQAKERVGFRVFLDKNGNFKGSLRPGTYRSLDGGPAIVNFPPPLIAGIIKQMEDILDNGFAEWVNYLDMGHAHPSIRKSKMDQLNEDLGDEIYQEEIFAQNDLILLYHLAEKIDFYQGQQTIPSHRRDRFLSRNVLGKPMLEDFVQVVVAKDNPNNTYGFPQDHPYMKLGETIYFHGNKNGCFQLRTRNGPINFDMTLVMPSGDPEVLASDSR